MKISQASKDCLRLSMIEGFGLKNFHHLLSYFGSLELASCATLSELEVAGFPQKHALKIVESNRARSSFDCGSRLEDWLAEDENRVISIEDSVYPELLRHTHLAPPMLYVSGAIELLNQPQLAIVGSRKPSVAGKALAEEFAFECARSGMSICSGMALGIDAASHLGALAAKGRTVAVLATGADRCYPQKHLEIKSEIIATGGAVISEMPLGTPPLRHNFPRRNRIVSGLSLGVLVIEAGLKSGSLITARYAIEQNREVFAVPGGARNPATDGCNWLIKDGAQLVTEPRDVLMSLASYVCVNSTQDKENSEVDAPVFEAKESRVLSLLGDSVMTLDELFVSSGIELDELSGLLLGLELKGVLAPIAGGYQRMS